MRLGRDQRPDRVEALALLGREREDHGVGADGPDIGNARFNHVARRRVLFVGEVAQPRHIRQGDAVLLPPLPSPEFRPSAPPSAPPPARPNRGLPPQFMPTGCSVPDLTVSIEPAIAEGGLATWAGVYCGAYAGRYPDLPTGRGQPEGAAGVSLTGLRDARIRRETIYSDAPFLAQAGARPRAGSAPGQYGAPVTRDNRRKMNGRLNWSRFLTSRGTSARTAGTCGPARRVAYRSRHRGRRGRRTPARRSP